MTSLERTYACGVSIDSCYTLEQLCEMAEKGNIDAAVIPVDKLLEEYPAVRVTPNQANRFKNGGDLFAARVKGLAGPGLYRVYGENKFLGLGELLSESESLTVKRVYVER